MAKERAAEAPRTTVVRSCLDEKELHHPLMLTFGGDSRLPADRSVRVSHQAGDSCGLR